jgi:hypothetical protein
MLWGFSEVNAWLLWEYANAGTSRSQSFAQFRRRLNHQILHHPTRYETTRPRTRGLLARAITCPTHSLARNVVGVANTGSNRKRLSCRFCGYRTDYHCTCDTSMTVCGTRKRPECFASHVSGIEPKNRAAEAAKERHKRKRAEFADVTRS